VKLVAAALVVGSLVLIPGAASAQCAMCRSVFGSPEGQSLAAAFRAGTILLLAAPIVSFATVALLAVRQQRRRDAEPEVMSNEGGRSVSASLPLQGSTGS